VAQPADAAAYLVGPPQVSVENQPVTDQELLAIRTMSDFDLRMVISEIHDHGWFAGRELIMLIVNHPDRDIPDA